MSPNHSIVKQLLKISCEKLTFLFVSALLTLSCGGTDSGASVENFGISVCSLGCNGTSFSRSQHFANQDLSFTFNDDVDPASVNLSSISIIDENSGAQPTGTFIVSGPTVVFRPSLIESPSGLQYGFNNGTTYRLTVNDETSVNVVRSLKGRLNQTVLSGEISIDGTTDLVPGDPSLVSMTPDPTSLTAPSTRNFNLQLVFNDIMQTLLLANPDTGESTLITVQTYDASTDTTIEIPGTFSSVVDRDDLTTTVTFVPSVQYPSASGGTRTLQVALSAQISDIMNNTISNPGLRVLQLLDVAETPGTLTEDFSDTSQLDSSASVLGLWSASAGNLDSGQDPLTSKHLGGSSGVLGDFAPSPGVLSINTNNQTQFFSSILNEQVIVPGGFFPFSSLNLTQGVLISAGGANPLRLIAQGSLILEGSINISGEDAANHTGKAFYGGFVAGNGAAYGELDGDENTGQIFESTHGASEEGAIGTEDFLKGGDPGTGQLTAGSGGKGGDSWYANSIVAFGDAYFTTFQASWAQWIETGLTPGATRYDPGRSGDQYLGTNGEGVGGTPVTGAPGSAPDNLLSDWNNGSGMGSWAWPPLSNTIPGGQVRTHNNGPHSIHRSRGGGGGGYWTDGARGQHFVNTIEDPAIDGLGNFLAPDFVPEIDEASGTFEFNGLESGADRFPWDLNAAVSGQINDASGGEFIAAVNQETLDPESGFLLGGSGGGGAGMGQHGSIEDRQQGIEGQIGSWRTSPGGGGGAGGGAIQIYAGSDMTLSGEVLARGGDGATSEFVQSIPYADPAAILYGPPGDAGGGGGSGGAVLIESLGSLAIVDEAIAVDGGLGGRGAVGNHGGDGGSGLVRFNTATGSETLIELQRMVAPDSAVDSAQNNGSSLPNVGTVSTAYTGSVGDITAGDGTVFNGNASGVRSRWYEVNADQMEMVLTGYSITYEYFDGVGTQTDTLTHLAPTSPDDTTGTPVWIAMQGAWMEVGESQAATPSIVSQTSWIIPSVNGVTNGLDEFNSSYSRAVRFMLVFDQDKVASLMNGAVGGFFRVTDITFEYTGS
jgi:hypothetical protein